MAFIITPTGIELANSAAPHLLYGYNLLGNGGKIWMTFVAALAVVSTQNSTVNGLARICQGMAENEYDATRFLQKRIRKMFRGLV